MEAPESFHPVNILKASRGFPHPIRLGYTKSELYGDLTHLNTVDEHAIKVKLTKYIINNNNNNNIIN